MYYNSVGNPLPEESSTQFPRLAARASWVLPLVALGLGLLSGQLLGNENRTMAMVLGAGGVLMSCAGMMLALFSFTGIPRVGTKGVVVPAICGILFCCVYLGSFMVTMARKQAAAVAAQQGAKGGQQNATEGEQPASQQTK